MEYLIGLFLSLAVAGLAIIIGFDHSRLHSSCGQHVSSPGFVNCNGARQVRIRLLHISAPSFSSSGVRA
jgi:hypothetical protein